MLRHMLDDGFYERMKDNHHWKSFREQAAWYTMTGTIYHSWVPFTDMPNFGFHSDTSDELKYSLEELAEHIQIFPTEWNVTHVAGEEWPVFSANYSGVESSFLYVFRWFSIRFRISTSLQLLSVLFSGSVHFQLAC